MANKLMGIINCVAHTVPNTLAKIGVRYLSYRWIDDNTYVTSPQSAPVLHEYAFKIVLCEFVQNLFTAYVLLHRPSPLAFFFFFLHTL